MYIMPATHKLMRRVTADAPVAHFVIAAFGSVPGVIRNGMSNTFQHGHITDKTDVVEKFETHRCMFLENHTNPPHTHTQTQKHTHTHN
jgi:hypothetical protein